MKKLSFFFIVVLLTCLVFVSCSENGSDISVYTMEKDGSVYTLTFDEKKGSFIMDIDGKDKVSYLGSYSYKFGYFLLESESKGVQYVKVSGDEFSFIPSSSLHDTDITIPDSCNHTFVEKSTVKGTCSSRGVKTSICSACGKEKKEYTSYENHEYEFSKTVTKGTCKVKEEQEFVCKHCNHSKIVSTENFSDHNYGDSHIVRTDCRIRAYEIKTCKVCGYEHKTTLNFFGNHQYENGICTVCNSRENGIVHGAEHSDVNKDGVCDYCYTLLTVLADMDTKGYSLTDDGYVYFGMYPQFVGKHSASKIRENGIYIESLDAYYYLNETYKLYAPLINGLPAFKGSSGTSTSPVKGVTYAFVLSPIKWKIHSFTDGVYNLVCTNVLDSTSFLHDLNVVYKDKEYYNANDLNLSKYANDYESSDLYAFLNKFKESTFSADDIAKIKDINLPNTTDYFTYENFPEYTDYALVKSSSLVFNKFFTPIGGTSSGTVNVITVDNSTITSQDDPNMYIANAVVTKEISVSEKSGFLPVLNIEITD